jgi:deferrochelatase/peroxidase EfeB
MTAPASEDGHDGPRPEEGRGLSAGRMTRRTMLAGAALLGAGAGLGRAVGVPPAEAAGTDALAAPVAFYGRHQAGIATPQQSQLAFASFDLTTSSRPALRRLLERWTEAAAALTAGRPSRAEPPGSEQVASDPGEAVGLPPSRLTLTFGFGPTLFERHGRDRFGLSRRRPRLLAPLPAFPGDRLDAGRSGGDLCVQACADDPQVAFHAIHVLTRLAGEDASLRWLQDGFWSPVLPGRPTPRNLLGFKDGTSNIRAGDAAAMQRFVWVQPSDHPAWMHGGTYLVVRRIQIVLESWDSLTVAQQERMVGRHKASGAPLGAKQEHDPLDLHAANSHGTPLIPLDAHVRVAAASTNGGRRILRRGYSYSTGARPGPADRGGHQLDAGLFFIAFARDPARQFIPLQRRLATHDALGMFTVHTASAVFACPPGIGPGGFVGETLLG